MSVVDYIVVHELVYLKQKNHTSVFWEQVRMMLPDFETRKEWLKKNGKFFDI